MTGTTKKTMESHVEILNEAYRSIAKTIGKLSRFETRLAAYCKLVKLYSGTLHKNYYPAILSKGFRSLDKRPHVPVNDEPPELTDFEWSKIHADLAYNVKMAQEAEKPDANDVSN